MRLRVSLYVMAIGVLLQPLSPALAAPILSASFNGDFAELVADRFVAGTEVNHLRLFDLNNPLIVDDLSQAFFGNSDVCGPPPCTQQGVPLITQGPGETGMRSVPIDPAFFPVLASGRVGIDFLVTDTHDGLLAMDFLSITITTAMGTSTFWMLDENNGFGIGTADGANLMFALSDPRSPMPFAGPGGNGFDEVITGKNILVAVVIPEPSTVVLLGTGLLLGLVGLRRASVR